MARQSAARGASTFEAFFAAEHARLLRALYLLSGNREEAEELMQEAFLKVWDRWARVSLLDDRQGYLYRTALNTFRSRRRSVARAAKRAVGLERRRDEFAEVEERDRVARALAQLPARQRAAVVLTLYLGHSAGEAAVILDVEAVTVRVLTSQARKALRSALEETDG